MTPEELSALSQVLNHLSSAEDKLLAAKESGSPLQHAIALLTIYERERMAQLALN